jgi:hypothetical protein
MYSARAVIPLNDSCQGREIDIYYTHNVDMRTLLYIRHPYLFCYLKRLGFPVGRKSFIALHYTLDRAGLNMKFLIIWTWDCEHRKEVTERFAKWKPAENTKFLFPVHSIVGENTAFTITEGTDIEQIVRNVETWTDICTFEISPIIDSRELGKIRSALK